MREVQVTWKRAAVFLWAFQWRLFVIAIPVVVIFSFIVGLIVGVMNIDPLRYALQIQAVSFLITLAISLAIIKELLSKQFKGFRVVLLEPEGPAPMPTINDNAGAQ